MSYNNQYRDVLKQDEARVHWDTHVVIDCGDHKAARERRASINGLTYEAQLDTEFSVWHTARKLSGFDNFDVSPLGVD